MKRLIISLILILTVIISFTACNNKKTLVITKPNNLKYEIGTEKIDLTGGKVSIKEKGEIIETVDLTEDMLSNYTLDTVGFLKIEVSYKNLSGNFEIEVIERQNYIEVTKLPYKTAYGPTAKSENIELRGGELTAFYTDGTTKKVLLTDSDVTIKKVDLAKLKITIEFEGMSCDYSITEDINEVGYMVTTKVPSKIKYRKSATLKDVVLAGGEFDFYLSGIFINNRQIDENFVIAKEINIEKKYVVYSYKLSSFGPDYTDSTAEGYFDIEVVDTWPTRIQTLNAPALQSYHVSDVGDLSVIDLTDGSVVVSHNQGADKTISMTDERISIVKFVLDPMDHQKGIITIRYQDEIATIDVITSTFAIEQIEGHTDETFFEYCVDQLRDFTLHLDFENYPEMPQRLEELAMQSFDLFMNNAQIIAKRDLYEAEKIIIARAAFYKHFRDFVLNSERYSEYYYELCADKTQIDGFKAFYEILHQEAMEFVELFDDPVLSDVLVAENSPNTLKTFSQRVLIDLEAEEARTIPSALKAIEIYNSFEVITAPQTVSEIQSIISNPEYIGIIENAYTEITEFPKVQDDGSVIAELLQYWRPDIIYLIFEYYYDSSAQDHPEILLLNEIGVYPYQVDTVISNIFDLMDALYQSKGMMFIYYYNEFVESYDVLTDNDFIYKSAQFVYKESSVQVLFNPATVPSGLVDSNESEGMWIFTTTEIMILADSVYRPMSESFLADLFINPNFIEYFDLYTSMLKDYYRNPDLFFYGDSFEENFVILAQLYNTFNSLEQYHIGIGIDLHSVGLSLFEIISYEYYNEDRIDDDQFELYSQTWYLNHWLGSMQAMGVKTSGVGSIKDYINLVEDGYLDLYNRLKDNIGFDDLFGAMLDTCLDAYYEFKNLSQDLYNVIIYMVETNLYLSYSKNAKNSIYGMLFVSNYRQLLSEIEIWSEATQKPQSEFDNYTFLGETLNQRLANIENKYTHYYGEYEDDPFFKAFYKSARQWVFKSTHDDYMGIGGEFMTDMQDILEKFPKRSDNPTTEQELYRFYLIERTYYLFGYLLEDYCVKIQMQPDEITLSVALFLNYYQYLRLLNAEELNLTENEISTLTQSFIINLDNATALYSDLERISSEFYSMQFDKLYDTMMEFYNQIQLD